jgi:hypothetical protein
MAATTTYSLRSWPSVGLMAVIAVPRIVQLFVDPGDVDLLGVVALVGAIAAGVLLYAARLTVDDHGVVVSPWWLHTTWDEIESFEARPKRDHVRLIRVQRTGRRPRTLTPGWLRPERGALLLDELEQRLSDSRSR